MEYCLKVILSNLHEMRKEEALKIYDQALVLPSVRRALKSRGRDTVELMEMVTLGLKSIIGAKIENSMLYANIAYPGLVIEYKQGDEQWKTYTQPVKVTQDVWVRSKTPYANRVSRKLKVTHR